MANKYEIRIVDLNEKEANLTDQWKHEVVLNLSEVKGMLQAFQAAGLKEDSDCLIFHSKAVTNCFRRVGQQRAYNIVMSGKQAKEWDQTMAEAQARKEVA